eukprot:357849-Chlamydomonas_euryale.AAC.3
MRSGTKVNIIWHIEGISSGTKREYHLAHRGNIIRHIVGISSGAENARCQEQGADTVWRGSDAGLIQT